MRRRRPRSRRWRRRRGVCLPFEYAAAPPPQPSPASAGLSHMAEQGEQEAVVPAGALDFSAYGGGTGTRSKNIEREPAQDSEVLGSIVLPRSIAILVEMDVEHPMQLVLDRPVTARDLQQSLGGHRPGEQVIAHDRRLGAFALQ